MAVITPDSSGAMSAPRTARSVPTAWNSPCHSVNCALAVDTVWGGMPWEAMFLRITFPSRALKPNSPPKSAPTINNMMIMRLVINATPRILPWRSVGPRRLSRSRGLAVPPAAAQRLEQRRGVLERVQHVRDVLEGGENGLSVLREGLVVGRFRAALLRPELSGMKDRLQEVRAEVPDRRSR